MARAAPDKIAAMVRAAERDFTFYRRGDPLKGDLLRVHRGRVDQLRDGRWRTTRRLSGAGVPKSWDEADTGNLTRRARRFLLADLDEAPAVPKATQWRKRLYDTRLWRWLIPPLQAGAARKIEPKSIVTRCRSSYVDELRLVEGDDLLEIRSQILGGYQADLDRISRVEQRANIFLGASVLTSSLVLGNAGLLLSGSEKLAAPYLQIAAAALAIASACAIVGAFRALQATLFTFDRFPPTAPSHVFNRLPLKDDALIRDYVAATFVAANRAGSIADWKVDQMKGARRWILATTVGVAVLTIVVLVAAV